MTFDKSAAEEIDGQDISPNSVSTDSIQDNQDGQAWETLKVIGYETGDRIWWPITNLKTIGGSTASSSYTSLYGAEGGIDVAYTHLFPDSVDLHWQITFRVAKPNGDQIDVRLHDSSNSETFVEETGITSTTDDGVIGPAQTNPADRTTGSRSKIEARNSDNTTTVSLSDGIAWVGVQL